MEAHYWRAWDARGRDTAQNIRPLQSSARERGLTSLRACQPLKKIVLFKGEGGFLPFTTNGVESNE